MTRLRHLRSCVKNLVAGASKSAASLTITMVIGMVLAGSTVLCQIARTRSGSEHGVSKRAFRTALQRIDRGLASLGDELSLIWKRYMAQVKPLTCRDYDVIAVDMSEIVKPHGKKMEHLCVVRDASKSSKAKPVLQPGWWTVEIVATTARHWVIPLLRKPWSQTHPNFKSQNDEVLTALDMVKDYVSSRALWVFDRGFDAAQSLWTHLHSRGLSWVVRAKKNRSVRLVGQSNWINVRTLALSLRRTGRARAWESHKNSLRKSCIEFGWCTVEIANYSNPLTLLCVQRAGRAGIVILFSNVQPADDHEASRIAAAYCRRWLVEETTRFDKQMWDIEDVRVLKFERLNAILTYTVITCGLLALEFARRPKAALTAAIQAPIVKEVPPFPLYRLLEVIRRLLLERRKRAFQV